MQNKGNTVIMENLNKLISALKIIRDKEPNAEFSINGGELYIGNASLYLDDEKLKLQELNFIEDEEYECFCFIGY